eukprot:358772-Chlamydomonas_euryale.AAC.17
MLRTRARSPSLEGRRRGERTRRSQIYDGLRGVWDSVRTPSLAPNIPPRVNPISALVSPFVITAATAGCRLLRHPPRRNHGNSIRSFAAGASIAARYVSGRCACHARRCRRRDAWHASGQLTAAAGDGAGARTCGADAAPVPTSLPAYWQPSCMIAACRGPRGKRGGRWALAKALGIRNRGARVCFGLAERWEWEGNSRGRQRKEGRGSGTTHQPRRRRRLGGGRGSNVKCSARRGAPRRAVMPGSGAVVRLALAFSRSRCCLQDTRHHCGAEPDGGRGTLPQGRHSSRRRRRRRCSLPHRFARMPARRT